MRILTARPLAAALLVLVSTQTPGAQNTGATRAPVSGAQLHKWTKDLTNWGRWGKDDELGMMNLVTPAKKKQAAALVKDGISMSLGNEFDPKATGSPSAGSNNPRPFTYTLLSREFDRISMDAHYGTHLDALSHRHVCWDADGKEFTGEKGAGPCNPTSYNGYEVNEAALMAAGARNRKYSLDRLRDGVVTRAILMDMPRLKGVPFIARGTRLTADDFEAWEKKAGVKITPGDALVVRLGAEKAPPGAGVGTLDESVLPWFHQRDVAVYMADVTVPLAHFAGNILATINIMNAKLGPLSDALASRNRWEFMLIVVPMQIPGGTGSPVNPIAMF